MKNYFLTLVLIVYAVCYANAQQINRIEYFFDTDPGFGQGIPVMFTPSTDISDLTISANVSSLSIGFHQVYVRSRNNNGNWSMTGRAFFYKTPASTSLNKIAALEYFFDTDPGFGNGHQVNASPTSEFVTMNINADISLLPVGMHQLYFRSKDSNNNWSITNRAFFYKVSGMTAANSITSLEYFFDTDPGFGHGTPVTITPSSDIANLHIATTLTSLSTGIHQLYIRSRDASGNWSITNRSFFYKLLSTNTLSDIVRVEYFYDTDPGFGHGTGIPITPGTDLANLDFANDLCTLASGMHQIFVRSLDANGHWSVTNSSSIDIQQAIFFADADHDGYGNPAITISSCHPPIGYVSDSTDCNDADSLQHPNQIWYYDHDGDHYGTGAFVVQCTRPLGAYTSHELIAISGDCDDYDATMNPGSQYFSFSGTPNFTNSLISPLNGNPSTTFSFEINYVDSNGALPPPTFPRVVLDYEGNHSYTDPNDRVIIMTEYDVNDQNTVDGKKYIATFTSLPVGTSYQTSVQTTANGCTTIIGPFNYPVVLHQPDIEIFANDITFSNPHPSTSSPLTVSAVIHNISDYTAENFVVHLRNQYDTTIVYPDLTVSYIPPHGQYTVSWNITTPSLPAWCPMEVDIDFTNVIAETNELDNSAIRPFVNGNYNLPGGITVYSYVNPYSGYPNAYTTLYGSAHYFGTAIPLADSSVAGATVNYTIVETGASYSTYSNSNGNFAYSFPNPSAPGIYHIQGTITDFTLTGNFNTQFEVIGGCTLPDLMMGIDASNPYGITIGNTQSITLVAGDALTGHLIVSNGGAGSAGSTLLSVSNDGSTPTLGISGVPSLSSGASFVKPFSITYPAAGYYVLNANADAGNTVAECSEYNTGTINVHVLPNLPDITPYFGPGGTFYNCEISSVSFTLANYGGAATGPFACNIVKRLNGIVIGSESVTVMSIPSAIYYPMNYYTFSIPFIVSQAGEYTFELQCDLPNNSVIEADESNNISTFAISILVCKPNFTFETCESFDVASADGDYAAGSDITLKGVLLNSGNLTYIGNLMVRYQLSGGAVFNQNLSVNLPPGTSIPVSQLITAPPPATQSLVLTVDPGNLIDELNEQDNTIANQLCWDYYPDSTLNACNYYYAFWNRSYLVNQAAYFSVGVVSTRLYDADTLHVKFEVSGPGLTGTVNLGNASIYNVQQTCFCPVQAFLPTSFVFPQIGTYTFTITVDPDHKYTECDETNNVMVKTVQVVNLPDMRILSQHIAPSMLNPQPGQAISMNVTYENIGYPNLADQMKLKILVDNIPLSTISNVSGLVSGENATMAIPNTWSSTVTGVHVIRAIIDADNTVTELDELNNEATRSIVVGDAANLYFQAFTSLSLYPALNSSMNVKARIGNSGDLACEGDMKLFYVNNNLDTILFHTSHVILNAHDSINLTIPWTVLDNKTTIIGKLVNSTVLEFTYDDNQAQFEIGKMNLILNSSPACGSNNLGSITATVVGGEPPYNYNWGNGIVGQVLTAGAGTYNVIVTDITGQTVSGTATIIECPPVSLDLRMFIQGYYLGASSMASVMMNEGGLNLASDVDSVTIELHDTISPYGVVSTFSGMLQTDGHLTCYFPSAVNESSYYIAVRHRNAVLSWSSNPVSLSTNCAYDFTTSSGQAYGENEVEVEPGIWSFYSGDINQDENIDLLDLSWLENDISDFQFGYFSTDINGDGNVDLLDSPVLENNINNFIYSAHPF